MGHSGLVGCWIGFSFNFDGLNLFILLFAGVVVESLKVFKYDHDDCQVIKRSFDRRTLEDGIGHFA